MEKQKPVEWIGSSLNDLRTCPAPVRYNVGQALNDAQNGDEHRHVKALKGFGGRSTLEVVEDYDGDTYRAVYTVKFSGVIYVLHVLQKKSKKGRETPQHEIDVVKARLKTAEAHYAAKYGKGTKS